MQKADNPRVVLDTNLIISAIIAKESRPDQLLRKWRQDKYTLLVSKDLLEEIKEVSQRDSFISKYPLFSEKSDELFVALKLGAEVVNPLKEEYLPVHCRDPKDDKILALALGGHADYLVTGDKDLLALYDSPKISNLQIITAKNFLLAMEDEKHIKRSEKTVKRVRKSLWKK